MGELAADPALADTLREEIIKYARDGNVPPAHLSELRKMDSVMRELTRVNPFSHGRSNFAPLSATSIQSPSTASSKPRSNSPPAPNLPSGTNICLDANLINFSPAIYPIPLSFSGVRHHDKRQSLCQDQRFKFANLGPDSAGWGDGLQAYPVRLLAHNTLKIIVTYLLMRYEFRLREGEGKQKEGVLPNGTMYPDMWAKILFRSRV